MRRVLYISLFLTAVLLASMVFAEEAAKYAGSENCQMCHPDVHGDWAKTRHAKAYDLLVNVGEEKNAKCLPCHTTGYGHGGFIDAEKTPGLQGVQCEACHGPGEGHDGDKEKIVRVPSGKTCAACHQKSAIHNVAEQ